jgi:hypothetical protein
MSDLSRDARNDSVVDAFLTETGASSDILLRDVLIGLHHLPTAPSPSAELDSLMRAGAPVILLASRRRTIIVVTLVAVAGSLGLGVSTAAAVSPELREYAKDTLTSIVRAVTPHGAAATPKPTPTKATSPRVSDTPATLPPASVPGTSSTPDRHAATPQPSPGASHRPVKPPLQGHGNDHGHPKHPSHP